MAVPARSAADASESTCAYSPAWRRSEATCRPKAPYGESSSPPPTRAVISTRPKMTRGARERLRAPAAERCFDTSVGMDASNARGGSAWGGMLGIGSDAESPAPSRRLGSGISKPSNPRMEVGGNESAEAPTAPFDGIIGEASSRGIAPVTSVSPPKSSSPNDMPPASREPKRRSPSDGGGGAGAGSGLCASSIRISVRGVMRVDDGSRSSPYDGGGA